MGITRCSKKGESTAALATAQLADVAFVDGNGKRSEIAAGLLGYVLPGATMHWPLKLPAAIFAGEWQL